MWKRKKTQLCQIRKRCENYLEIMEEQEKTPRNLTVHSGTFVENPNLVESLYDWVIINFQ